jgi:hypothetical protein
MMDFCRRKNPITLIYQDQRGFLFFLMVDQGRPWHVATGEYVAAQIFRRCESPKKRFLPFPGFMLVNTRSVSTIHRPGRSRLLPDAAHYPNLTNHGDGRPLWKNEW